MVDGTILVMISSYCDPMLFHTMNDCMKNASHPEKIRFAVVDQSEYTQQYDIDALSYSSQVTYLFMPKSQARGVCFARSICQGLLRDEDYILQVDSHTIFDEGWDDILVCQLHELEETSDKVIISSYPHAFKYKDGVFHKDVVRKDDMLVFRVADESVLDDDLTLKFIPTYIQNTTPVVSHHIAGGLIFTRRRFIMDIPYDPYLYFAGEEQTLFLRAYTHGYDVVNVPKIPIYHLYKTDECSYDTHHWNAMHDMERGVSWTELNETSLERFNMLVYGDESLGAHYGLGDDRTLSDYYGISGIDYYGHTIDYGKFNTELMRHDYI